MAEMIELGLCCRDLLCKAKPLNVMYIFAMNFILLFQTIQAAHAML